MVLQSKKGNAVIVVTLAMVALLSTLALVADVGISYAYKNKMQKAVEAAALAGAQELPDNTEGAKAKAQEYLTLNYPECTNYSIRIIKNNTAIEVKGEAILGYTFAKLMGFYKGKVDAQAKAMIGTISSLRGVKPLGIENKEFVYNQTYILKEGAGDGSSGNYGAIALGGTGSRTFEDNMKYGYVENLKIGDLILTETGNMAGGTIRSVEYLLSQCTHNPLCSYIDFERSCPRLMKLPVIETLNVPGRDEVLVVGFAAFFLEGTRNSGGHTEIIGKFVQILDDGTIDVGREYYGIRGVKLVP